MRYYLDTQLYSYLANGTVSRREWDRVIASRDLWLSPVTAYELVEGLVSASPHTLPLSLGAVREASLLAPDKILEFVNVAAAEASGLQDCAGNPPATQVHEWLAAAETGVLPTHFEEFRRRVEVGRAAFLDKITSFMASVMPNYRRLGDPLFSAEWQRAAGRDPAGENLDAPFVFQTGLLERAMRIRYNPGRHPSDYLDYLQLGLLAAPDVSFITADYKLARLTSRSLESDRIYTWSELGEGRLEA